jgi:hypothetical protein
MYRASGAGATWSICTSAGSASSRRSTRRSRCGSSSARCTSRSWATSPPRSRATPRRWAATPATPARSRPSSGCSANPDGRAAAAEVLEPVYISRHDWAAPGPALRGAARRPGRARRAGRSDPAHRAPVRGAARGSRRRCALVRAAARRGSHRSPRPRSAAPPGLGRRRLGRPGRDLPARARRRLRRPPHLRELAIAAATIYDRRLDAAGPRRRRLPTRAGRDAPDGPDDRPALLSRAEALLGRHQQWLSLVTIYDDVIASPASDDGLRRDLYARKAALLEERTWTIGRRHRRLARGRRAGRRPGRAHSTTSAPPTRSIGCTATPSAGTTSPICCRRSDRARDQRADEIEYRRWRRPRSSSSARAISTARSISTRRSSPPSPDRALPALERLAVGAAGRERTLGMLEPVYRHRNWWQKLVVVLDAKLAFLSATPSRSGRDADGDRGDPREPRRRPRRGARGAGPGLAHRADPPRRLRAAPGAGRADGRVGRAVRRPWPPARRRRWIRRPSTWRWRGWPRSTRPSAAITRGDRGVAAGARGQRPTIPRRCRRSIGCWRSRRAPTSWWWWWRGGPSWPTTRRCGWCCCTGSRRSTITCSSARRGDRRVPRGAGRTRPRTWRRWSRSSGCTAPAATPASWPACSSSGWLVTDDAARQRGSCASIWPRSTSATWRDPYQAIAHLEAVLAADAGDATALAELDRLYADNRMWPEQLDVLDRRALLAHRRRGPGRAGVPRRAADRDRAGRARGGARPLRRGAADLAEPRRRSRPRSRRCWPRTITPRRRRAARAPPARNSRRRRRAGPGRRAAPRAARRSRGPSRNQWAALADLHETLRSDLRAASQTWARALNEDPTDTALLGPARAAGPGARRVGRAGRAARGAARQGRASTPSSSTATRCGSARSTRRRWPIWRAPRPRYRRAASTNVDEPPRWPRSIACCGAWAAGASWPTCWPARPRCPTPTPPAPICCSAWATCARASSATLAGAVDAYRSVIERAPRHGAAARRSSGCWRTADEQRGAIIDTLEPLYESRERLGAAGRSAGRQAGGHRRSPRARGDLPAHRRPGRDPAGRRRARARRGRRLAGRGSASTEALAEVDRLAALQGRWVEAAARVAGVAGTLDDDGAVPLWMYVGTVQLDRIGDAAWRGASFERALAIDDEHGPALEGLERIHRSRGNSRRAGRGAGPTRRPGVRPAEQAGAVDRGRDPARARRRRRRRHRRVGGGDRHRRRRSRPLARLAAIYERQGDRRSWSPRSGRAARIAADAAEEKRLRVRIAELERGLGDLPAAGRRVAGGARSRSRRRRGAGRARGAAHRGQGLDGGAGRPDPPARAGAQRRATRPRCWPRWRAWPSASAARSTTRSGTGTRCSTSTTPSSRPTASSSGCWPRPSAGTIWSSCSIAAPSCTARWATTTPRSRRWPGPPTSGRARSTTPTPPPSSSRRSCGASPARSRR